MEIILYLEKNYTLFSSGNTVIGKIMAKKKYISQSFRSHR